MLILFVLSTVEVPRMRRYNAMQDDSGGTQVNHSLGYENRSQNEGKWCKFFGYI